MLPHHTVRIAERADRHLLRQRFPLVQHTIHFNRVVVVGGRESEGGEIVHDELALGGLVEHELEDLRAVLGLPELDDAGDGGGGDEGLGVLGEEEAVGLRGEEELEVGVDGGLGGGVEGDGGGGLDFLCDCFL